LQQFEDRTGIATSMDADVDEGRISRDMATAGFRILQEALTNVARHAEATEVSVRLRTEDDVFTLRVTDNGRGLRPDPNRRSLGLLGMRERARQLGGSVAVENAPASGVTVLLKAPLNMVENPQPPQASAAPR
jgi:signal transduction histidine kinase